MKIPVVNPKYFILMTVAFLVFGIIIQHSYGQSITVAVDGPLSKTTLDGSVVTVTLTGGIYEPRLFSVAVLASGIAGVTIETSSITRESDTEMTAALAYDGTDFNAQTTLTFTVWAGAIRNYIGADLTATLTVHLLAPGERTQQVQDAILATVQDADASVSSITDVTAAHLAAIQSLDLAETGITELKFGDFDGLSALTELDLDSNQLSSLPEGIFAGLTALTSLDLSYNPLRTLPEDIFAGLTALSNLHLDNNALDALPSDIFSGLTALTELSLYDNALDALPSDIFSGLTALTELSLYNNALDALPDGIFSGLTALRYLALDDNALPVSLEKVAEGQFKAVAPTGAPFRIVLQLSVANGSISDGETTTTLTIPKGMLESEIRTVTRPPGVPLTTTVDIDRLPKLPARHSGYTLVKSADLPLGVISSICCPVIERTPQVRDAIVAAAGVSSAADVTDAHLAAIRSLALTETGITALQLCDFDGLSDLRTLNLNQNMLRSLPGGIFDPLTALTTLSLTDNQLGALPENLFSENIALTTLYLNNNALGVLPANLFSKNTALRTIDLSYNPLRALPAGTFAGLTALKNLYLDNNALDALPSDIFSGLIALKNLYLNNNALDALPSDIFSGLMALTDLSLYNNALDALPNGIFSGLIALKNLELDENELPVSLEKVGEGQFKAVAPTGAPFEMVLPVSVANGSINGAETTLTIPIGSLESGTLTVTRTPDVPFTVTVNIGELPEKPQEHSGYTLRN